MISHSVKHTQGIKILTVLLMILFAMGPQFVLHAATEPRAPTEQDLDNLVTKYGFGSNTNNNAPTIEVNKTLFDAIFGFVYAVIGVLGIMLLLFAYQRVLKGEPQHQDALWKTMSGIIASVLVLSILKTILSTANPDLSFIP